MPDVYSGWTMTIPEVEAWRSSVHCPDKYKYGNPYRAGDVSALHALLDRFLKDLGVQNQYPRGRRTRYNLRPKA
ncbi:hypothetical protein OPQ81_001015 [Rhizoctonia solani]|nr:hypothetical protein OPQ81_001015 [Rhizoctonia solani]